MVFVCVIVADIYTFIVIRMGMAAAIVIVFVRVLSLLYKVTQLICTVLTPTSVALLVVVNVAVSLVVMALLLGVVSLIFV